MHWHLNIISILIFQLWGSVSAFPPGFHGPLASFYFYSLPWTFVLWSISENTINYNSNLHVFKNNICLCHMTRHLATTILHRTHLSNTSTSMTKTCTMTFNHKVCNGIIRTERRIAWWFKKSQTQCHCHEASLYDSTRRKLLVKLACWVEHQLQKEHNQSVLYAG